ncbi:radical SAM protein [Chloroflexota bacterium]
MAESFFPAYVKLLQSGELKTRVALGYERLRECDLCAWNCRIDRTSGKTGICKTGKLAMVSSYGAHMGEEDPLRGWRGSGTIFFSWCNLRCQYCQNFDISQQDSGNLVQPEEIAAMMLDLQNQGSHNINFVSPSHVIPQILASILIAAQAGLRLPLVFNTGGYDSLESLYLLDGVIDIYMPDMKYASARIARYYSKIPNYPEKNQAAVREMHSQVGDLLIDERGIARQGLLVRHLVLPNRLAGTEKIVNFLAEEISKNTYLNLMDQYRPAHNAGRYPKLRRSITQKEFDEAQQHAKNAGLERLDQRKPFRFI